MNQKQTASPSELIIERLVRIEVHEVERDIRPYIESVVPMLRKWGMNADVQETTWVIAYDNMTRIRTYAEVARGDYRSVDIPIPAVMSVPLLSSTDRFIIAHNHPTGDIDPTVADLEVTQKVMAAANACGLLFEDHLILGPNDDRVFSFREAGLITDSEQVIEMAQMGRKVRKGAA